jgi:hypothetical protein
MISIAYRIWQIGKAFSASVLSNRTVNVQVEGALTGVDGDCQYVLFRVTVPPQVSSTSVTRICLNFQTFDWNKWMQNWWIDLPTQQTLPRLQEPLGFLESKEQAKTDVQIPASPLDDVQASILLTRLANGLNGRIGGVNRLLNRLVPELPKPKRFSCLWPSLTSTKL